MLRHCQYVQQAICLSSKRQLTVTGMLLLQAYKFMDSLDPDKEAGAFGYMELKPPEKGQPGYPRLMIENRCYQSTVFRKLHLEVAYRQDGLQVGVGRVLDANTHYKSFAFALCTVQPRPYMPHVVCSCHYLE